MAAAETAQAAAPGYRAALAVGEFRVLFTGFILSLTGDVVAAVALTVLVFARTGSPFLSGLTFTLAFTPYLIAGTLFSSLVERLPPRRLMVGCDLLSSAMVAGMAAGHPPIWALLGLLAALGLVSPIQGGTRTAVLGDVLPGDAFVAGRSLFRLVAQSAQVVGNAAGAALLVVVSPRAALAFDALTFVVSALLTLLGTRVRPPRAGGLPSRSLLADSVGGVRRVLAAPLLRRVLLLGWFVPFLAVWPESVAAASVHELGRSGAVVGLWLAALPAGVVIGELAAMRLIAPARRTRMVAPLAACVFVPLLVFALEPRIELAIPLLVLSGAGHGYSLGLDTLIIRHATGTLRDRVFTVFSAGQMAIQGLGFAIAGALAELVSPHLVILLAGALGLAVVAATRPPAGSGP
jgi:MFS family permease